MTTEALRAKRRDRDAEAEAGYRLDDQVGFLLRRANQRHVAIFADHIEGGLTPTQWAALARLYEDGPSSQNRLGRNTAMDGATVKGVVDRLAARRLIATGDDPRDGRHRVVALTDEGRALVEAGLQQATAISEETLAPLTAAERTQLIALLRRLG